MKIRVAKKSDAKDILDIYRPYIQNTTITFEYSIPSHEDMSLRIERTLQKYPYLVVEDQGKVIGYAYASALRERKAYEWACELSIYIEESYHGQGIASKLYLSLFEILKKMNIQTLYACITFPNDKSEKFHQSLGFHKNALFQKCGYKFGKWLDVIWMEKSIGEYGEIGGFVSFSSLSMNEIQKCLNN